MKTTHKIILGITGLLALIGGALGMTASVAVGATPILQVFQGGTGSSTLTGILLGNGTSSVRSITVGSGLTLSGTTLSAAGGSGLTSLNGQIGATQLFASSSSAINNDVGIVSSGDTHTFNWPSASAYNRGFLTAADFTTFNNKADALSGTVGQLAYFNSGGTTLGSVATGTISGSGISVTAGRSAIGGALVITNDGVTSISASAPLVNSVSTGAVSLTCNTASGSQVGCLSSTDWTTFNNKAGFSYLFPSNATSSLLSFTGGLIANASSTIQNFNSASSTLGTVLITGNATGTNSFWSGLTATLGNFTSAIFGNATSTNFFATQAMFTTASSTNNTVKNLTLPQFSNAPLAVTSAGTVYGASTSTPSTFTFATSSLNVNSTTTVSLAGYYGGATIAQFGCTGVGGTFTSVIGDGTASSTYVVSSNSLTTTYTALSSNNAFTSGEKIFWAIGPASAAGLQSPSCSWLRN